MKKKIDYVYNVSAKKYLYVLILNDATEEEYRDYRILSQVVNYCRALHHGMVVPFV
jgi:hypothetical protein